MAKTRVTIRITERESIELQKIAREEGITMSEWIRDLLYEKGIGELQEVEH